MMQCSNLIVTLFKLLSIMCGTSLSVQNDTHSSNTVVSGYDENFKTSTISMTVPGNWTENDKISDSVFTLANATTLQEEETTMFSLDDIFIRDQRSTLSWDREENPLTRGNVESSSDNWREYSTRTGDLVKTRLSQGNVKWTSDDLREYSTRTHDLVTTRLSQGNVELSSDDGREYTVRTSGLQTTTSIQDTKAAMVGNDYCKLFGTCLFQNNMIKMLRFCRCDSLCTFFEDCCHDSPYDSYPVKTTVQFKCGSLLKPSKDLASKSGILLIDKCRENLSSSDANSKCKQNMSMTGPYAVGSNGIVFKNKFCAECNNVSDHTLFQLKITKISDQYVQQSHMDLNPMQQLSIFLSDPHIDYTLIPPSKHEYRSCMIYEEIDINDSSSCPNYFINPLIGRNKEGVFNLVRNVFCGKNLEDMFLCFGGFASKYQHHHAYTLSVLFSFSKDDDDCGPGQKKIGELCIKAPVYTNTTIDLSFRLIFSHPYYVEAAINQVFYGLLHSFSGTSIQIVFAGSWNVTTYSSVSFLVYFARMRLSMPMTGDMLLFYRSELNDLKWNMNMFIEESQETVHVYLEKIDMGLKEIQKHNRKFLYKNSFGDVFRLQNGMTTAGVYVNETKMHNKVLCSDVFIQSTYVNKKLYLQKTKCNRQISFPQYQGHVYTIKLIITYVGCSLSVIALGISIIISRKFATIHSVPGNNLENLSFAIAFSNVLFMIGVGANDYQTVCYVLGIVIHYIWLVTFSFMSISVTYICRNLTKMVSNKCHDGNSRLRERTVYTVLGLMLPLIFVIPSVTLDYFGVPKFSAKYSGSVCFPTGFLSNLVFVSIPITLSVFVNLIALIIIIVHVTSHSLKMNHVRRSQSFQQVWVYLRICAFSGIFWITGIVGELVQSFVIDFVFIILCSLQGLGVALANLTTKRICNEFCGNPQKDDTGQEILKSKRKL